MQFEDLRGGMDTYDLTRIFGALCASLLLYLGLTYLLEGALDHGSLETPAYAVAVEEAVVEETVAAVSIAEILALADVARGDKVFRKCAACHVADDATSHGVGPALWGIVGRDVASLDGFSYSGALADLGGTWDWELLDAFLTNPRDSVPGTKMSFAGLKKPADRGAVMLWLNQKSDTPLALPE